MENVGKKSSKTSLSSFQPRYSGNLNTTKVSTLGSESLVPAHYGAERKLSYSFKYFSQDNNFGLRDGCEGQWFVSILKRLQSLNDYSMGQILENSSMRKQLRIHEVDFNGRNVSINRSAINSIPSNIRNNEREFPFYEISIARSRGRIFGFFDDSVFYVVYLDRHHNMYPMEMGVTRTYECVDHYDELLLKLGTIVKKINVCDDKKCKVPALINELPGLEANLIYLALSDDDLRTLLDLQKIHKCSWEDIFEKGLFYYLEQDVPN